MKNRRNRDEGRQRPHFIYRFNLFIKKGAKEEQWQTDIVLCCVRGMPEE